MIVLLITGACGSGKTTIANELARRPDWVALSEDEVWPRLFGKNRGPFGSDEHRRKRAEVHAVIHERLLRALAAGNNVALDATVHESPPEAFEEYGRFFATHAIRWRICVLYPRLEVAIARDATRSSGTLGAERVASLHAKFTGDVFGRAAFFDNSDETPEDTVARILNG